VNRAFTKSKLKQKKFLKGDPGLHLSQMEGI